MTTVEQERDRLREVLKFYADHRNHRGVGASEVYRDRGERARKAVGRCQECEGRGYVKTGRKIMDQDGPYDETGLCRPCYYVGRAVRGPGQ